jgi:hypothetical protein
MRRLLLATLIASPVAHAQLAQDTVTNPAPGVVVAPNYVPASSPAGSPPSLYTNGSLISQLTGGGPSGTDPVSILQTPPDTDLGFGCTNNPIRLADDFTVPAGGWTIQRVDVFGYQTQDPPGGSTVSPFTTGTLRIWSGPPNAGGSTIVFGDTTTNRQTSTGWSGVWRVPSFALTNQQRPIMRVTMDNLNITLPAGTYWLDFSIAPASGTAFCPPNTSTSATNNALQLATAPNTWQAVVDGGSGRRLDFPFQLFGTPTPPVPVNATSAWSLIALMLALFGLAAVAVRRYQG